ncbi:MAG: mandelate racemase/muconate lactonizing enzyme family protein [Alphaproteobacteria bacterium]
MILAERLRKATSPIQNAAFGTDPFTLTSLKPIVLRAPIREPVRTAFKTMQDRPALIVRAQDADGTVGWGEVWCNFPSCGAEHRARLIETEIKPLLVGRTVGDPGETFDWLSNALRLLVLQTAEVGPIAQAIAGVDIALWDIASKRAGQPLWKFLGGRSGTVRTYTSGIGPDKPADRALRQRDKGFTAFKFKIGFDEELDLANLQSARSALGPDTAIMVDANQAWQAEDAARLAQRYDEFGLTWLEEPIPADSPIAEWQTLAGAAPMPLAAGENMRDLPQFETAAASGAFRYLQPDIAKWGGVSGCLAAARAIREAGVTYCPHWLGGGLGLVASAHLLAAVGRAGLLEVDSNDNPLREGLAAPFPALLPGGGYDLGEAPGLGVEPDPACLASYGLGQ